MSKRDRDGWQAKGRKRRGRRRVYSQACRGKIRYRDRAEAIEVLHAVEAGQRQGRQRGETVPQRAYYCDGCHGWHLTKRA
jgi:hypothetical protein